MCQINEIKHKIAQSVKEYELSVSGLFLFLRFYCEQVDPNELLS